jgi:hypothetical protein
MAYADEVLAEASLLGYWKLGEASGTNAEDFESTNDGTYTGGFTLGVHGPVDETDGTEFNGSSGYVTVPNVAALTITDDSFSIEFWYASQSAAAFDQVVSKGLVAVTAGWVVRVSNDGTALLWQIAGPSNGSNVALNLDGQWHHVVFTYDGAETIGYQDGALETGPTGSTGNVTTSSEPFQMARTEAQDYFPGRLAQVALYGGALSAARVTAHFDAAAEVDPYGEILQEDGDTLLQEDGDTLLLEGTAPGGGGSTQPPRSMHQYRQRFV